MCNRYDVLYVARKRFLGPFSVFWNLHKHVLSYQCQVRVFRISFQQGELGPCMHHRPCTPFFRFYVLRVHVEQAAPAIHQPDTSAGSLFFPDMHRISYLCNASCRLNWHELILARSLTDWLRHRILGVIIPMGVLLCGASTLELSSRLYPYSGPCRTSPRTLTVINDCDPCFW